MKKYPPGPHDGLLGIMFIGPMQAAPLTFAADVARKYGDFTFVRIGWVRLYFINRPELIREVLATKVKCFRKLARQMRALRKVEGNGLVASDGAPGPSIGRWCKAPSTPATLPITLRSSSSTRKGE